MNEVRYSTDPRRKIGFYYLKGKKGRLYVCKYIHGGYSLFRYKFCQCVGEQVREVLKRGIPKNNLRRVAGEILRGKA